MNKIRPFIMFAVVIAFGSTSCNKSWDCVCSSRGTVLEVRTIKTLGKWGAKSVCDSYQYENNRMGANEVCVIK